MFSIRDMQEITQIFPPDRVLENDSSDYLPPLLRSKSENELLTRAHVLDEFEQIIGSGKVDQGFVWGKS